MRNPSLAFVFPGQGSQKVGMLSPLRDRYPVIAETFAEANDALGEDLAGLIAEGPAETLNRTEYTQPAILAASIALWRAWRQVNPVEPDLLAGHSLGEYSALVAAGALSFPDAVRVVRDRGRFMQAAVPEGSGAMAAIIGLDDDAVRAACVEAAQGDVVSAVNFNAPGQVVIAGTAAAVERAGAACKAAGAKRCLPLPVSVPSHCALMAPAAEQIAEVLAGVTVQAPALTVLHNVDAQPESDPDGIRGKLVAQLCSPVLWVDTVRELAAQGIETVLECGPGKVLTGLNKRIDKSLNADGLEDLDRFVLQVEERDAADDE